VTLLFLLQQTAADTTRPSPAWTGAEAYYRPVTALILLFFTLALLRLFISHARNDPPRLETHWGGLGGGLGGWRMSASLGYLLAMLAFGAMFTGFTTRWLLPPEKNDTPADSAKAPARSSRPTSAARDSTKAAPQPRDSGTAAPPS
jgi:hypothetical protein